VVPRPVSEAGAAGDGAQPVRSPEITVDRVGPGGGVASDSAFGVALVTLWQEVAEAGGPVGFAAPVVRADIAARAALLVDGVKTGRLIAVAANRARRLIGAGFLRPGRGQYCHTGRIELLLVDPAHTGAGLGSTLLTELLGSARAGQLRLLDIEIQDGAGLAGFFGRFGFTEWGRRPGWIELGSAASPDRRDEVLMGVQL
jgi:GNAT superfamily N-acetyltransferase